MRLKWWQFALTVLMFCCAADNSADLVGRYENVEGDHVLQLRSGGEVEIQEGGGPILLGEYSLEPDGRLRVVAEALGMTAVVYFQVTQDGLVEEEVGEGADGKRLVLFSEKKIAQAREDHICDQVAEAVADRASELQRPRKTRFRKQRAFDQIEPEEAWSGVFLQATGVEGSYFVVLGRHPGCPGLMIHDTRDSQEPSKWVTQDEGWRVLMDAHAAAADAMQAEKKRREEEAQQEAERKAALLSKSRSPTRTLGTFKAKHFHRRREFQEIEVTITDVDLQSSALAQKFDFQRHYSGAESGWFAWITECSVTQRNVVYPHKHPALKIEFGWTEWNPTFYSESDRAEFVRLLEKAVEDWRREYREVWLEERKRKVDRALRCKVL